ncbi:MAG: ABC transporter permease [Candidatus Acetothermia bacterium]
MVGYLTRKLLELVATLLVVSLVVFLVVKVLPGDPAQVILGVNAKPAELTSLREQLGLNRPLHVQYGNWLAGLLTGNLGNSVFYEKGVGDLIRARLGVTLPLAFLAILLSTVVAIPLGTFAATHHRGIGDFGVITFSQIGLSIPSFWLGMLALLAFSVELNLLPSGGFPGWTADPIGAFKSLILPVSTLALIQSAALIRMTRSATLDILSSDFVSTARGKGLRESRVLYKHVLRNSVISVLTLIGLQFGQLLAGAVVVEMVFHLPGLGRLLILAVQQRDLPLVQGIVTLLVGGIILINFLVDLGYSWLDPRIRLS